MQQLPSYNVVAVFPDVETARSALENLRSAGVDEDAISLLGRPSEDAFGAGDDQPVEPDQIGQNPGAVADATDEVGAGIAAGGGSGAAGGGLLGLAAGAAITAIPGVGLAVGLGALIGAAIGAAGGATAGGILGGASKFNDQFRQDVREGRVLLGVHSDDRQMVEDAKALLEKHDPGCVESFENS